MKRLMLAAIAALGFIAADANAAGNEDTKPANATITVKKKITLTKVRDLHFPDAYQGDAADTVLASDANNSASFSVSGTASVGYQVNFPQSSILMITGGGGAANKEISVGTFTSNLSSNQGTLDGSGAGSFQVGASRAALAADQVVASDYTGSFNVRVVYQ